MNELLEQVQKLSFARLASLHSNTWLLEYHKLMDALDLPAILALLESVGDATPSQVRAALTNARCDCGKLATCFGSYEGQEPSFGCDTCCGHGCEDGHCDVFYKRAAVAQEGGEKSQ